MDTGLHYKTLDEELSKCPVVSTPEQTIQLIDLIVCRESSWQCGTMLIQNILSCLQFEDLVIRKLAFACERAYFADLQEVFDNPNATATEVWPKVLDAYMVGLAKSTGLAMTKFRAGIICPEEDVGISDFGANFMDHIDTKEIIAVLEGASKWVRTQKKFHLAEDNESLAASLGAVLDRLEFRTEVLYIVNEKKQPKKSHINLALDLIDKILATQVTDVDEKDYDCCFSCGIQSRVSNNNPLRSAQKLTISEAYDTYKKIFTTIEGYRVIQGIKSATDMLSFFVSSATNKDTLPLSRVFLQVIAQVSPSFLMGQKIVTWAIADMKDVTCPRVVHLLQGPKSSLSVDNSEVLSQLAACYEDLLKANMVNRARQRQNLAHCIVAWDTLQVTTEAFEDSVAEQAVKNGEHAETIILDDRHGKKATVPALPISSWVYLRKVQMMIWVVLLGFELDIYKIWEYGYMYRYVEYLVMTQESHLQRTLNYLEQTALELANKKSSKSKGKGGKSIAASIDELQVCLNYLTGLSIEAQALHSLCTANMFLAEAAVLAGYAARPTEITSHTSPELLYGLRMKPFSSVGTPELPPYQRMVTTDLEEGADVFKEIMDRLAQAKRASLQCREVIDHLGPAAAESNAELRCIKRSAVGVAVSCSMMESSVTKKFNTPDQAPEQQKMVVVRQNYHWYFPVLSFEPATKK